MSKLQKHERQFHKNPAHAPPEGLAPEPHRLSESLTRNTDTGTIKWMVWQGRAYFIVWTKAWYNSTMATHMQRKQELHIFTNQEWRT